MTGGGDTDEFEDMPSATAGIDLNENDRDPTAGASDIGGRAGGDDAGAGRAGGSAGESGRGGGQSGWGKGPTGS